MKSKKYLTNLFVMVTILVVGFGCKSIKMPSLSGDGGGVSGSADPKEVVVSAYKKFMDQKFYHSVVTTKNAQATVETELDYNAPDRFWIKNKLPNMKSEVIAIGGESYTRLNEGKWSKMPAGNGLPVEDMRGKLSEEAFAAMKDFESIGRENLNGKEALVYKFNSTFGGNSSSKMWVSTDSGLPLQVETEGDYSGTHLQMTIKYDYENESKIEAPNVN